MLFRHQRTGTNRPRDAMSMPLEQEAYRRGSSVEPRPANEHTVCINDEYVNESGTLFKYYLLSGYAGKGAPIKSISSFISEKEDKADGPSLGPGHVARIRHMAGQCGSTR